MGMLRKLSERILSIIMQIIAAVVTGVLFSLWFALMGVEMQVETQEILSVPSRLASGAFFGYPLGTIIGAVVIGYLFNVKGSISNSILMTIGAFMLLLVAFAVYPENFNSGFLTFVYVAVFPLFSAIGYNIKLFGR